MNNSINNLLKVVKTLRDPQNGCPWDLVQTHKSLIPYLEEECYELIGALREESSEKEGKNNTIEELGDVLLQILLHCQIASEKNHYNFEQVVEKLTNKLIFRHPHVFGDEKGVVNKIIDPELAKAQWDEQKKHEKEKKIKKNASKPLPKELLSLPVMQTSFKFGEISHKLHFDWEGPHQVLYKVEEEWQEVKELIPTSVAIGKYNLEGLKEEIGDLLFTIVQLARHLKIRPEEALDYGNRKFFNRFNLMDELVKNDNKDIKLLTQEDLEGYWNEAKSRTKSSN